MSVYNGCMLYLTFLLHIFHVVTGGSFPFKFEHVTLLEKQSLDDFRNSANVRAVYYYKRDMTRIRTFMNEYEQSAEFLEVYGVKFGLYDCRAELVEELCHTELTEHYIYTYRQGAQLLKLELQTMFDVNSIMSNILQLVLLREVPILQRREEREEFEYRNRGVRDVIFTFQKAIGTYEHRIFMEVAYAYSDNFQFALSTTKESLQNFEEITADDSVVWVLECKDMKKADPCPRIRYHGDMDLASFAQFVRALTFPKQFDIPGDGSTSPYVQDNMDVIYLYYKQSSQSQVMHIADKLAKKYRGMFGVVTVNLDTAPAPFEYEDDTTPAVGIVMDGEPPIFLREEVTEESTLQFVSQTAQEFREFSMSDEDGGDTMSSDTQDPSSMASGESSPGQFDESEILAVETQDDEVAEAVFRSKRKQMDLELVQKLTDMTFTPTVQHKDLLLVLFYLPFDDRSMAFLRAYGAASRQLEYDLAKPLARVDCHDWTDVCSKENVTMFPTVRIYRKGEKFRNYMGMLDTQNVVKTVKLLNHTELTDLKSLTDIQNFIDGKLPSGMDIASESVVLGLFEQSHKNELDVFTKVGKEMEDRIMFGLNKNGQGSSVALERFGVTLPAVVVIRRTDTISPHTVYTGRFDETGLEKFISQSRIPSMPELTVEMFPELYRQTKPFVITFLDEEKLDPQNVKDSMSDIVKSENFGELIFCWMSASLGDFGTKILRKYNPSGKPPAVSVVDLSLGEVYNYDKTTFDSEDLMSWLEGYLRGKLTPSTILLKGEWKPLKEGYNFLAMMDWEKINKRKVSSDDLRTTEEFGIGFDDEGNEVKMIHEGVSDEVAEAKSKSAYEEDQIRHELFALKKSRIYHHSARRKMHDEEATDPSKVKATEDGVKDTKIHKLEKPRDEL